MNLQQTFENWPEPHTPPFSDIKKIGCCSEHEVEFNWYRNHTWQDLRDLILSDTEMLDRILDTVQFGSLEGRVHRYFMKGVLSSLAYKSAKSKNFEDIDDWDWDWVMGIKYDLKYLDQKSLTSPKYSKKEIKDVITLLELIQKKFTIDSGAHFYDSDKEIKSTLKNWKSYLKHVEASDSSK